MSHDRYWRKSVHYCNPTPSPSQHDLLLFPRDVDGEQAASAAEFLDQKPDDKRGVHDGRAAGGGGR